MPQHNNTDNFNVEDKKAIGLPKDFFSPKACSFGGHGRIGFFVIAFSS